MEHWRHWARAVLTIVAAKIQRLANFQEHLAEPAHLVRFARLRLVRLHMLFSRTTPTNWTTVVGLDVNRNATFRQPRRLGQCDSAIDLIAIVVFRHRCSVVEVFGAKAFVAMVSREHSLAFKVKPPLKLTSSEIVDVIIWKKYEKFMKLSLATAIFSLSTCHKRFSSDSSYRVRTALRSI